METRLITFAGNSVAVEYSGPRPARIVDFLYRDVSADSTIPPHVTYRLMPGDEPGRLVLYRGDTLIYEGDSEATLAELLLGDTCYHLADQSRGGLLFHAAGLARAGKGLLLPGGVGAGKSTLAAWLAARGFDYLTDELVFVPQGADTMQTFTRPLNLKNPARAVLRNQVDFEGQAADILSSPQADLVSLTVLRPGNAPGEPPVSLIIFPRYRPGSDFILRPLSRAQAGLALMECLVNARNLPEHGFPQIARLARLAPAYKLTYAHFQQIGEQIDAWLRSLL
jgi:hypothetical protein